MPPRRYLPRRWDQFRGAGNACLTESVLQNQLNELSFACVHIAMLSWRYNNFNQKLEEE
jgi:hypothetical protein